MATTRHFTINPTMPPPAVTGVGAFLLFIATGTSSASTQAIITGNNSSGKCLCMAMPYKQTTCTLVTDLSSSTTIYAYAGIFRIGAQFWTGNTLLELTSTSTPSVTFSGPPFVYAGGANHYVRVGTIRDFDVASHTPYNFRENVSNKVSGVTYNSTLSHLATTEYAEDTGRLDVLKSATVRPDSNKYVTYSQLYFNENEENYNSPNLYRYVGIITYRSVTQLRIVNNVTGITDIKIDVKYGGVTFRYGGSVPSGPTVVNTTENLQGNQTIPTSGISAYLSVQSTNASSSVSYKATLAMGEIYFDTGKIQGSAIGRSDHTLSRDAILSTVTTLTISSA